MWSGQRWDSLIDKIFWKPFNIGIVERAHMEVMIITHRIYYTWIFLYILMYRLSRIVMRNIECQIVYDSFGVITMVKINLIEALFLT